MPARPFGRTARLLAALAAAACVAFAWMHLEGLRAGLHLEKQRIGPIPVTWFLPADAAHAPVVVIAHGFAGSQQLMQPFATTLARNGYVAATFDFPGHGANTAVLPGDIAEYEAITQQLIAALDQVVQAARSRGDGRVVLVGHSMASNVVVAYGKSHPEIPATVAISLFSPAVSADRPRNLLVIDGALEPDFLKAQGLSILPAGGGSHAGVTYGRFAEGSARRFALAQGVEHIGVLYSQEALAETLAWFNTALDRHGSGFLDDRGPWLGLLYLGLAALAWPLARLLPRLAIPPVGGAPASWRLLWPQILAPAVLVPLLLWQLPIHVLPILLGDYLALHFGLYGLLTVGAMALTRRRAGQGHPDARHPVPARPRSRLRLAAAALAAALYGTLVIGLATDRFAMGFVPTAQRAALILAMLAGILPYFLADEWLTRGPLAPRGAYLASKAAFLLSLVIAVALNPMRLFFLIILVPAILVLFSVYGLFSRWIYQRTGYPLVAAYANALAFAWFIGVSFPVVSR